jgi:hypothetical protein
LQSVIADGELGSGEPWQRMSRPYLNIDVKSAATLLPVDRVAKSPSLRRTGSRTVNLDSGEFEAQFLSLFGAFSLLRKANILGIVRHLLLSMREILRVKSCRMGRPGYQGSE